MYRLAFALFAVVIFIVAAHRVSHVRAQTISYAAGWNLVAGPQGAHVVGATGSLYTLQAGDADYETQPITAPLTACRGYWAYFPTGGSLDPGPFGNASVNCSVNVSPPQYVMMGNPSGSQRVTVSGGEPVYTYDPTGGYQLTSQLTPGRGAWVYAAGPVTISVASAALVSSAPPAARPARKPTTITASATRLAGSLALTASPSLSTCS